MLWKRIFGQRQRDDRPYIVYGQVVAQARSPGFYLHAGVPDTVEGRYEMVLLHAYLILRRLQKQGSEAKAFGQRFFDVMFDDLDQTLRELGVGDLVVGKRINKLASGFYGRIAAYDAALAANDAPGAPNALEEALQRNVYQELEADPACLRRLADYVRKADAQLAGQSAEDVMEGKLVFPESPQAGNASGEAN